MDGQVREAPRRGDLFSENQAMSYATELAGLGAPFVSPNPCVGCVVLDSQNRFLSAGYHEKYGQAHAEVNAVKGLSESELKGARVFVTLEPCAHEGKTPSCAKMLARLPLAEVVYGLVDPNPLVAGQGLSILQTAGIKVSPWTGPLDEIEAVAEKFLVNFRHQKLFVGLKVASSLDGQVALESGESQWITGPEAREEGHWLRATYDALMVGSGTIKKDNPSLNVRHPRIQKANQLVVLDRLGALASRAADLNLLKAHAPESLIWVTGPGLSKTVQLTLPQGVRVLETPVVGETLDLPVLLQRLWDLGLRSVLVESGPQLSSAFLQQNLVHRLHLFLGGKILGRGQAWSRDLVFPGLNEVLKVSRLRSQTLGSDLYVTGLLKGP